MGDIGINVRVDAQTEGLARAGDAFDKFKDQFGAILGMADPEKAEQYWVEFNSGLSSAVNMLDKLTLAQQRIKQAEGGDRDAVGGGAARGGGGGAGGSTALATVQRTQNMLTNLIRGAGGDTLGTGLGMAQNLLTQGVQRYMSERREMERMESMRDILGGGEAKPTGIGGMLGSLSTPVKGAMMTGLAVAGVSIVANELSKTYEKVAPGVMEATAALKNFAADAKTQGQKFVSTMDSISNASAKYGYSLDQGISLNLALARGGAGVGLTGDAYRAEIGKVSDQVMAASRALGLSTPSSEFASLGSLGSRFGRPKALGVAFGNADNVFGSQRAQETAAALASMFSDQVNQGVIGDPKELGATQAWMYRVFGERAAGAGGAAMYSGLSGAVRGSTSLGSETDILKYQAARALSGGSQLDALKLLEGGFSVELFNAFQKSISGASEWDKTFLTSQAFGVNLTTAGQMVANPALAKEYYDSAFPGGGSAMGDTAPVKIIRAEEIIANKIRDLGAPVTDFKAGVMDAVQKATVSEVEKLLADWKKLFGKDAGFSYLQGDKTPEGLLFSSTMTQLRLAANPGTDPTFYKNGSLLPEASSFSAYLGNPDVLAKLRARMTAQDYKDIENAMWSDGKGSVSLAELKNIAGILKRIADRTVTVETYSK